MMHQRRPHLSGATRPLAWLALLLSGTLLQACAPNSGAGPGSRLRLFAADLSGAAKTCEVPKITPGARQTTEAEIKLVNDGGWCGLPVHQPGPKPYNAGLLVARPANGTVLIHAVGDETRIDYTPDRGFAGSDSFTVKLLPDDATIQVAANVTTAAGTAASPTAPAAAPARAPEAAPAATKAPATKGPETAKPPAATKSSETRKAPAR